MRKALTFILILCLSASFALADADTDFYYGLNVRLRSSGVPEIRERGELEGKKVYHITDNLKVLTDAKGSGKIKSIAVFCNSDEEAGDFLCTCVAVMNIYENALDMKSYGYLLTMFSMLRGENPISVPIYTEKLNNFSLHTSDSCKYMFIYDLTGV